MENLEEVAGSYMVEQMLSSMKTRAASSCRRAMVIFRPKTFNRPMFKGTTRRRQGQKVTDKHLQLLTTQPGSGGGGGGGGGLLGTYGPPRPGC